MKLLGKRDVSKNTPYMSNLYLFLYLQPLVKKKKKKMIIPGLTLYLLCPNFIPLDPPRSWISVTKHYT